MMFLNEEIERYQRQISLNEIGESGQLKLKNSKVLVIGAGGLGCVVLQNLVMAGVGKIGLVDDDIVEISNLQRQVLYSSLDVGKNKVDVAFDKLLLLNPHVELSKFKTRVTNRNVLDLLSEFDVVVDCTDNLETRYVLNDACLLESKPLVFGAIHKFQGQVSVLNYLGGPTYRCLFPESENQVKIQSCNELGVLGVLPSVIGSLQATEVLKICLEIGNVLSGKLLIYDSLRSSFNIIGFGKNLDLKVISREEFLSNSYGYLCETEMKEISIEDFRKLDAESFILDVRESWEQPNIENKRVLNAPLDDIDDYIDEIPQDQNVYVVCQKGGRSLSAISYLKSEYDFDNLVNVKGGILG